MVLGYSLKFSQHSWYQKGNKLAREKQDLKAIAALEKAIDLDPQKTIELIKQDQDFSYLEDQAEFHNLIN